MGMGFHFKILNLHHLAFFNTKEEILNSKKPFPEHVEGNGSICIFYNLFE